MMIDQSKLAQFWDENVPDKFKHFQESDFRKKREKYEQDLNHYLVDHIDFSDIKIALDWGCGGGLGAFLLSNYCDVVALDIAESSLRQCENFLLHHNKKLLAQYRLEDINSLVVSEEIDLLFSASLVQHFPSYEYWKMIGRYWMSLEPKWIAVQTRHGEEIKANEGAYFDEERNYILGLFLPTEEVMNSFGDQYELMYHKLIDDNYSMYEYFVFRKYR